MKIGITGPNKIYSKNIIKRKLLLDKVAKILAESKNSIVLTPDKNSLLEYFGKKYLDFNGKEIWIVAPTKEKGYKEHLNVSLGKVVSCREWDKQADEFNRQSDIFICLGFSWGALKEIACCQYFNKKKVYVLKEFISRKLPSELNFLVEYISIKQLKEKLK